MNRGAVPPRAEILSIGEELLGGETHGGNAEFIAGGLERLGFRVRFKTTVGDLRRETVAAFRGAVERVELVVATGGLGPTGDDQTIDAVAEALEVPLRHSESLYRRLRRRLAPRRVAAASLRRQCRVPRGFRPLPNRLGTAPGWIRLWPSAGVVLLPGVPAEMRALFVDSVAPRLERHFALRRPVPVRCLHTAGLPEPRVDRAARRAFRSEGLGIPTVLASGGIVEIRIGPRGAATTRRIESRLRRELGAAVFGVDGDTLEAKIGALLRRRRGTVAVAESCTGGLLGARLTAVPGASAWFRGGVIAYHDTVKRTRLGMPAGMLRRPGAVSARAAGWMARTCRRDFATDFGVAITGEAGPVASKRGRKVGELFVGLSWKGGGRVARLRVGGDREQIRNRGCVAALDLLRRRLEAGAGGKV